MKRSERLKQWEVIIFQLLRYDARYPGLKNGDMELIDSKLRYYALYELLKVEKYSNFWIALGRCHMNRSPIVIINEKTILL